MRAITLQQPWATAIAEHGKDIENRTWAPGHLLAQRFAIHAGLVFDEAGARWIEASGLIPGITVREMLTWPRGAVVCTTYLLSVVTESASPWFGGPVGWRLIETRRLLRPVPQRGAQGLWTLTPDAEREVLAQQMPLEGALDA